MNKNDRKRLAELIDQIQELVNEVDEIGQAEQEKFDNLTEGLQQSERGQQYQEVADAIVRLAGDAKSQAMMVSKGLKTVDQYSPYNTIRKFEELF